MSTDSSSLVSPVRWREQRPANTDFPLQKLILSLHDQAVELRFPESVEADIKFLFSGRATPSASPQSSITIEEHAEGRFSICAGANEVVRDLTRVELPIWLIEEVAQALITRLDTAVALHAGAVAWKGTSIILAGASGSGKSSLVAWLIDNGFEYLTDEIVILKDDNGILGYPRALVIKSGAAERVQVLSIFERSPLIKYGSHLVFSPAGAKSDGAARPCGMIVFPQYQPGAAIRIKGLTAAEAGLRLVGCNLNARNFADGGFGAITRLSRAVPAISVEYGDFAQLEDTLDAFIRLTIEKQFTGTELRQFAASLSIAGSPQAIPAPVKTYPIPPATPRKEANPKLTIGMATYDDYDGVYFSLQALRLYHREILDTTEFLLIDNHPDGACSAALKSLENSVPNFRYVPQNTRRGTSVKDFVFEEAAGELVLCMDSHVFVAPGALKRLVDYFDANKETSDLVQGPLVYDDLTTISTHFRPEWSGGMYGCWSCDERGKEPDAEPFDIPMQGMGLFACRRAAWPGFNPKFRGFGGEEGYIHEKFRQRGGRTLCLPFLRWVHRFNRPNGVPYPNIWQERIRNYVIGFRELGLGTSQIEEHFAMLLGAEPAKAIFQAINEEFGAT